MSRSDMRLSPSSMMTVSLPSNLCLDHQEMNKSNFCQIDVEADGDR